MSILYDPKDRGFSEAMFAIDRCQIAMVRELANSTDGRLILKGGMTLNVAQAVQKWVAIALQRGPTPAAQS